MKKNGTVAAENLAMTEFRALASHAPSMLRGLRGLGLLALCAGSMVAVGCGVASSATDSESGGRDRTDNEATGSSSGSGATPPIAGAIRQETILVHASPDLPALRLCLGDNENEPIPADNIMPRTNQVGVDVGGAASLGALAANVQPGSVAYLFRASVTERRDVSGTPQRHQSCKSYLGGAQEGYDYWTVTMPALDPSSLLVISGCGLTCADKPSLSTVPLSAISVPKKEGNISAAFVSLTPGLIGSDVSIDLTRPNVPASLLPADNLALNTLTPPRELSWPALTSAEIAATSLVVTRKSAAVLRSDFASMASYVNLSADPVAFYKATRFVFVALGEVTPMDSHPQRGLHLLALPLDTAIETPPDPRNDGGTIVPPLVDAGSPTKDGS